MKAFQTGQVQLSNLIFTHNWEDPATDEQALKLKEDDVVFAITSGGCNTLGFLRYKPAAIYCVDINPAQTYLMELKQAGFKYLSHIGMQRFFGLKKSDDRLETYRQIRPELSRHSRLFWDKQRKIIRSGILMNGRYEMFVKLAGKLLRFIQGQGKTKAFFKLNNTGEQKEFYVSKWDNKRWHFIFKAMFNKKRLAKKGLNKDYFHFDNDSSSFSESFYKRAGHAMAEIPVQSNYFIALYLLGHYLDDVQVPNYLKAEYFDVIKCGIDKIHPVTFDCKYWLEQQQDNMFDAMSLSNICELMDEKDTYRLFKEVARTAKPGAGIIFRNLMIHREVPEDFKNIIVKDESLSKRLMVEDRSFVYANVEAYSINK